MHGVNARCECCASKSAFTPTYSHLRIHTLRQSCIAMTTAKKPVLGRMRAVFLRQAQPPPVASQSRENAFVCRDGRCGVGLGGAVIEMAEVGLGGRVKVDRITLW